MSAYTASCPAFTIPMSMPARMAWYRKDACIASRTASFPRKAKERFETPPETSAPGHRSFRSGIASMNAFAKPACSSMPVATARMFGSRMMSSGANPACSMSRSYARPRIATLRSTVSACPRWSKAITTTAAP